jgi:hypothetical protein
VELGAERLENLLPVLVEGETATGRESDHVTGVELPVRWLAIFFLI